MTNLEVIRPFIERFITAVSNSLRLEMAIFDGKLPVVLLYAYLLEEKRTLRPYSLPPGGY